MKKTAIAAVLSQPWAMTRDACELVASIAAREHELAFADNETIIKALEAKTGEPLGESRRATVRDGIAILTIEGPLMAKANIFSMMSGATSYQMMARDLAAAEADPAILGAILVMDTPGGSVFGMTEFAAMVKNARKPVWAFATGQLASAGYLIASAADKIYAADVAMIGSIGAVLGMSVSEPTSGAKQYEFVSAQSPLKRVDPGSDAGKVEFQRLVDDSAQVFIDTVATNRAITAENVLESYGKGAVFLAADALKRGMIDGIGTFESVFTLLKNEVSSMEYGDLNIAALSEKRPDLVKAIGDQAIAAAAIPDRATLIAEGASAERARITAIEANSIPGAEQIIAAAKADPTATADATAVKIFAAIREGKLSMAAPAAPADPAAAALAALRGTEASLTPPVPGAQAEKDKPSNDVADIIAAAKAAGVRV